MTYLRLPIKLYNKQEQELQGKELSDCELMPVELRILPSEIESYRPSFNDETKGEESGFHAANLTISLLRTKSGDDYYIYMTCDELDKLILEQARWETCWKGVIQGGKS